MPPVEKGSYIGASAGGIGVQRCRRLSKMQLQCTFVRAIQRRERAKSIPRHSESGHAGAVEFRLRHSDVRKSVSFWIGCTRLPPHTTEEIQGGPRTRFVRICAP